MSDTEHEELLQLREEKKGWSFFEKIAVLNVKPGDKIVLRHPGHLSSPDYEHLKRCFHEMFPNNQCLVLEESMKIEVVREEA
jgi:aminoglycoside phosphotransferase (APT) family kinase protein